MPTASKTVVALAVVALALSLGALGSQMGKLRGDLGFLTATDNSTVPAVPVCAKNRELCKTDEDCCENLACYYADMGPPAVYRCGTSTDHCSVQHEFCGGPYPECCHGLICNSVTRKCERLDGGGTPVLCIHDGGDCTNPWLMTCCPGLTCDNHDNNANGKRTCRRLCSTYGLPCEPTGGLNCCSGLTCNRTTLKCT